MKAASLFRGDKESERESLCTLGSSTSSCSLFVLPSRLDVIHGLFFSHLESPPKNIQRPSSNLPSPWKPTTCLNDTWVTSTAKWQEPWHDITSDMKWGFAEQFIQAFSKITSDLLCRWHMETLTMWNTWGNKVIHPSIQAMLSANGFNFHRKFCGQTQSVSVHYKPLIGLVDCPAHSEVN